MGFFAAPRGYEVWDEIANSKKYILINFHWKNAKKEGATDRCCFGNQGQGITYNTSMVGKSVENLYLNKLRM